MDQTARRQTHRIDGHVPERIVIFGGHMVDTSDRTPPRFPARQIPAVQARLRAILEGWEIGPDDLALCGGAQGGDLLFAECCLAIGAPLRLLLPLPEPEFIARSVEAAGTNWRERYQAVRARSEVWIQPARLGPPAPGENVYERNNRWLIETALAAGAAGWVRGILVWDGQAILEQPGGTADFAAQARHAGIPLTIIDPARP